MREGFEKRFNKGDIVYWCHHEGNANYSVKFGMVDEQFSDAVCIDYLSPCERRVIDGVPLEEFESEEKYHKLPKGWTYNTKLFELSWRELPSCLHNLKINIPEDVRAAYEHGFLVKDETLFWGDIKEEITKEGFRIRKKYPMWKHHACSVSIRPDKVCMTYEEAQAVVDANIAEFKRQAELSDYDWSVEQIDKNLCRWQALYSISDEEKEKCREFILGMKDVENIETRLYGGKIQWKYVKNKKWNNIEC